MHSTYSTGTTPFGGVLKEEQPKDKPLSPSRFLAVIGHGCSLMVIRRVALVVTVLPSLTLLYSVSALHTVCTYHCMYVYLYVGYPVTTSLCSFYICA